MKALIYKGINHPLQLADVPMPVAEPGGLVFKVDACGICASDLHAAATGLCPEGIVFGHEYAGEVVAIGEGVAGWSVGDRMVAAPGRPCCSCEPCRAGRFADCTEFVMQGFDPRMPGAYAEYSTAMAELATKIPASLDARAAATVEPLAVGLGAYKAADVTPGASVLVIGAGVIGLAVAKWARFFGAGDIGISEKVPARIQRAREIDVGVVIDADTCPDPVTEFARQTGRNPSVIFECVGRPMLHALIEMAPNNTQLVLVGTGMQPENFTVLSAAMKRLRMTFVLGYEPADFPFTLRMLGEERISSEGLVSAAVPLEEAPAMFARLQRPNDHCKVVITP